MKHSIFSWLVLLVCAPELAARDIALSYDGTTVLTANHDAHSLSKIDVDSLSHSGEVPLGMAPDNLYVDGTDRVWVTFRLHDLVGVYDLVSGIQVASIDTGDEPFDVLQVSDSRLAVTLFGAGEVIFVDGANLEIAESVPVDSHPRGLALSADETKLYVTHFRTGALTVLDVATYSIDAVIQLESNGNLSQNVAVASERLYLPNTRSNVTNPNLTFDSTVFPVVSVVDPIGLIPVFSERFNLDIVDQPVGIPIDAALSTDFLFVLNAASNDLTVINRVSRLLASHIELGHHPRSMVLSTDQSTLFVHNSLGASVSVVDTDSLAVISEVAIAPNPLPASLLNGKQLFNSSNRADLARDQWISCATCHFDGEMDGRTWFFPDGPRNTPSLLGSGATGPYHWSGDLDEIQDVEATIREIQAGTGLAKGPDNCTPTCDTGPPNSGRSQDLDDLAAFIASLELQPNPNLNANGQFSDSAMRGSTIFASEDTGCFSCHIAPLFTDHHRHDIGTGGGPGENKGPDFDTPSLRGIFSSGPYLHDGRALTLVDVLTTHNPDDKHGTTSSLTQGEMDDLVAFLKSLTLEPPMFRSGFE